MTWKLITEFHNGWKPHPEYPPKYRIVDGVTWLDGSAKGGEEGKPCARLPEEARPGKNWFSDDWWGDEHQNYHSWYVDSDGYLTIIEISKDELLKHYLKSLK